MKSSQGIPCYIVLLTVPYERNYIFKAKDKNLGNSLVGTLSSKKGV